MTWSKVRLALRGQVLTWKPGDSLDEDDRVCHVRVPIYLSHAFAWIEGVSPLRPLVLANYPLFLFFCLLL